MLSSEFLGPTQSAKPKSVSLRRPWLSSRMFSPFRSQLPEQSEDFLLLQPWVAEVVQRSVDVLQQVALGHQLRHELAALIGLIQLHLQPTHLPSP